MIRMPGVCNGDSDTTVLCHLRMAGITGMGLKANDMLGAWGCSSCHTYCDTHGIDGRTALLEGMARTQALLIRDGYLKASGEGPHCSTCSCGMELLPEAQQLTTGD